MAGQYQIPGGPYVNAGSTRQWQIPRGPFVNEAEGGMAAQLAGTPAAVVTVTGALTVQRKLIGVIRDKATGSALQVANWRWAVFSANPGGAGVTLTDFGTNFTSDANGNFELTIPNSAIAVGQTAFLLAHNSDGTLAQNPKAKHIFLPITVS